MRASITTGDASRPVEFTDVSPPTPAPNESIVAVGAFGLNRGELMVSLLQFRAVREETGPLRHGDGGARAMTEEQQEP